MEIREYSFEEIKDPTNIIEGKRFEFLLDVEVDEDDELYSEFGIEIRVIIGQMEEEVRMINYFLIDKKDNQYLDFGLEEDEEEMILQFCKEELLKAE
ncbi:pullulanase [Butyricicoccus sp. 1XD8-22]|nr:pullulanase [Butyricicoccus sp. 1XD8-22]